MKPSPQKALRLYETMKRIRLFETTVEELFASKKISGFVHLSIGQEAVATGVCASLRRDDYITSTHRGHGHMIAKGADVRRMMAELFGKRTGYCRGKGGSMHIADFSIGVLGANGVVGGGFPIAVGAGLSAKLRGTEQVVVCFFGEGASNRGTFHEALNIAAIWKLPIVFLCENNRFASTTRAEYSLSVKEVSQRACSYGIPGRTIDGSEVLEVFDAASVAVQRAREGGGPSLVEALTYRYKGHFEGDPQRYRKCSEVEKAKQNDPIDKFRIRLEQEGLLDENKDKELTSRICKELEEAVRYAQQSPYPEPEEALLDAYAGFQADTLR